MHILSRSHNHYTIFLLFLFFLFILFFFFAFLFFFFFFFLLLSYVLDHLQRHFLHYSTLIPRQHDHRFDNLHLLIIIIVLLNTLVIILLLPAVFIPALSEALAQLVIIPRLLSDDHWWRLLLMTVYVIVNHILDHVNSCQVLERVVQLLLFLVLNCLPSVLEVFLVFSGFHLFHRESERHHVFLLLFLLLLLLSGVSVFDEFDFVPVDHQPFSFLRTLRDIGAKHLSARVLETEYVERELFFLFRWWLFLLFLGDVFGVITDYVL